MRRSWMCAMVTFRFRIGRGWASSLWRIAFGRACGPRCSGFPPLNAERSRRAYNEEMEHVANSDALERDERSDRERPLVFLDTNVIIGYLQGIRRQHGCFPFAGRRMLPHSLRRLTRSCFRNYFSPQTLLVDLSLNELWIIGRQLPVDIAKAEALLPRVRALRNRLAHPNDILILSSADEVRLPRHQGSRPEESCDCRKAPGGHT